MDASFNSFQEEFVQTLSARLSDHHTLLSESFNSVMDEARKLVRHIAL